MRILSLPDKTPYALLLEVGNYHVENWLDCLKMKYFMKKVHWKGHGRLYRIIKGGIVEDVEKLCEKYDIPNVIMQPVSGEFISVECKEHSRMKSRTNIDNLKKIPKMINAERMKEFNQPLILLDGWKEG